MIGIWMLEGESCKNFCAISNDIFLIVTDLRVKEAEPVTVRVELQGRKYLSLGYKLFGKLEPREACAILPELDRLCPCRPSQISSALALSWKLSR